MTFAAGEQKLYEALVEAFLAEGTTDVFALMGSGNAHWLNAFAKQPEARIYYVRDEGHGLAMADGWARVKGKPGVCTVTCGPGLTQLATSLVVARRARTPLVILAGDLPETAKDHQLFNQARFAEATEARFVQLNGPEAAYDAVRKAFYIARTESRPVLLNVPMDLIEEPVERFGDYVPSTSLLPAAQRPQPDPEQIAAAVRLLRECVRPVIVAGRGAIAAGAEDAILRLADRSGALIATTLLAKGFLSQDEFNAGVAGLFAGHAGTSYFADADCVIGIGASLNYFTLEAGYLFSNARFIQIDRAPQVLMGNAQVAECYIQADARSAVEAIVDALAHAGHTERGLRRPEVRAALIEPEVIAPMELEAGSVDPRRVAAVLDESLPPDVGLVMGIGHFTGFLMSMRRPRTPFIITLGFGSIGQGLGTAIGAAIATGKKLALVDGDTSIHMSLHAEFDTLARYKPDLLVIVMNDQASGAEYHILGAHGQSQEMARIPTPDLAGVAKSFGMRGRLVRTLDELRPAIAEFMAGPGPMIVDLRVAVNVLNAQFRRMLFAEDV